MFAHPDDNWSIKSGSALITTSLIMANEMNANDWLTEGWSGSTTP